MRLTIYQIDAFARQVFQGNPAAVCPLREWLPDETMQAIASENNLSETAFFVRSGEFFDIRWFTPGSEIELCGHATLASAFVIFEILQAEDETVRFRSHLSGELGVEKQGGIYVLDFPSRPPARAEPLPGLFRAIGKAPKEVFRGRDYFLVYGSEKDVLEIEPDFAALLKVPIHGVIVTAPGDGCDFVSRFFAPEVGVFEDPVTGSSHCNLIPFWAERLGKTVLFARQVSARGGELFCELHGDRVKIGGQAALYMKGEIHVEN
jgi:predicted PhzF superfamily epimerase YddE/YHI9